MTIYSLAAAAAVKLLQSCLTLCDPIDGSAPDFSVPGILQARILEWVASSFSNAHMHAKSFHSCPTLWDPIDSSPPSSSVHRTPQAIILEWVTISFSMYKLDVLLFLFGTSLILSRHPVNVSCINDFMVSPIVLILYTRKRQGRGKFCPKSWCHKCRRAQI